MAVCLTETKVRFLIHRTNLLSHFNLEEFNKFGIVGNPRPGGILQGKDFRKKEELNLKKMMKTLNILCKLATNCSFRSHKHQFLMIMKMQSLF